jgi:hypothetical protein
VHEAEAACTGAFIGQEVSHFIVGFILFAKVNLHSIATFSLYPSAQVGCRLVQMHFGLQMLTNFKALEVENPRLGNAQGFGLGF